MSNIMPTKPALLGSVCSCFAYGLQLQEAPIMMGGAKGTGEGRHAVLLFLSEVAS